MTLTTNGKDYIAREFGIGNCWVGSGLSWVAVGTDGTRASESGGTKSIVGRLLNPSAYASIELTSPRTGTYTFSNLFSANDNQIITLPELRDADPNYCVGVAPPTPPPPPIIPPTQICTPNALHCYGGDVYRCSSDGGSRSKVEDCPDGCTNGVCDAVVGGCTLGSRRCNGNRIEECRAVSGGDNAWFDIGVWCEHGCTNGVCNAATVEPGVSGGVTETGPIEVIIKEGSPHAPGAPSVNLDTSKAFAYFKATPVTYVGVMDIFVHNPSVYYAYFAWEMRMWKGKAGITCPTTTPEHQTISRFLGEVSDKKVISVKMLGANENAMIGGSFEIPAYFKGTYTLCLSLWGNYDKQALLDELLSDRGYEEEIPW